MTETFNSPEVVHEDGTVGLYSVVEIQFGDNPDSRTETLQLAIWTVDEDGMVVRKVSPYEPLGKAIMGKKKGDTISYSDSGKQVHITIRTIC